MKSFCFKLLSIIFVISCFSEKLKSNSECSTLLEHSTLHNKGFDINRLVIGGSFGISFGDYTIINISPQLGYTFNKFTLGGGVSYNYYGYSDSNATLNYLGLNAYVRYQPIQYISLQVQPEIYGQWGKQRGVSIESNTVPVVLVGAGGTLPIGGNSGVSIMFYYDLIQNEWSPYGNEVFYSIGYNFRF